MKKFLLYISAITTIIASLAVNEATAAERPRLLVNIVVSGMRTDDLVRYNKNFSNGGFNRLINNGAYFTNASYDYMQTTTPVGLATLSTGAMPSTHGVVSDSWFDYVGNKRVSLIEDSKEQCVNYSGDAIGYSPRQLIAETISDAMIQSDSTSQVATIAIEPLSAIVTAGHSGEVYWMETLQTAWTTSSYYTKELPAWITQYNQTDKNLDFLTKRWNALLEYDNYLNSRVACIEGLKSKQNKRIDHIEEDAAAINKIFSDEYEQMCYTPTGNSALLAFAKQMVANNKMGGDEVPDILNIVLDTPRKICSRFGPESVEYEDMLYRLDRDLEEFISFVTAQVTDPQQIVVTLCSDHGTSPSFDIESNHVERFNVRQAEVITNAFIGAQHGNGEWVLGYIDRAIYLNHDLIIEKGLSLKDMQHDVATFMMQLRGVSHAVAAEAMRNTYFGSGYGRKIQNGFYPRRSGDVIINLMPEWIEEKENVRSSSGSMYLYDREVPLIIFGGGVTKGKYSQKVDMTSLATTEARLLGIGSPSAAEGEVLNIF